MISVNHPVANEVVQRGNNNVGYVLVEGTCGPTVDCIAVEFTPHSDFPNQGEKTGRFLIIPIAGKFSGRVPVKGGWYELTAVACSGKVEGAIGRVSPVGVGEVFITFGHSVPQADETAWIGATDKRVVSIPSIDLDKAKVDFAWGHLGNNAPRGPFNANPGPHGLMGQKLVERLKVPVAIMGANFGGSNIEHNYQVIKGIPFNHGFIKYEKGMPYEPLKRSLADFAQKTGCRAVIVQHGINDAGRDEQVFYDQFKTVIDHTRSTFDNALPWLMILDDNANGNCEPERAAIRRLWELPQVFPGFDYREMTNIIATPNDKVHPRRESEWEKYASLLNASLNDEFFRNSSPVLTKSLAPIAVPEDSTTVIVTPVVKDKVKVGSLFDGPIKALTGLVPKDLREDYGEMSTGTKILLGVVFTALLVALIVALND